MMHELEKSDLAMVAGKLVNNAEQSVAESAEPRAGTKGNAGEANMRRTQSRESVSPRLDRIRQAAKERKTEKFTSLMHHITVELLTASFHEIKRNAAAGVDGVMWKDYAEGLERKLIDLHAKVQSGAYRALPARRVYIPKADGKQRPLAVAALEDKIVQRATATVLNSIYEEDFLGFSYGFRPDRGPHDALDALAVAVESRKVNFIWDADIRAFFDTVSQEWLVKFLEHRIADKRMLHLIQKWLKVGTLEDGVVTPSEVGTGQGSVISPLLANIYLHYVFDLWADSWRRHKVRGDMVIVRYADDIVVGFQYEAEARRFWEACAIRFAEFALSLHPAKTRLIEFGRFAAADRAKRGLDKPETFNFLGFTHVCSRSRRGKFILLRRSRRDRVRTKLKEVKEELRRRMHQPTAKQGRWLGQVVRGFFAYHAVPLNGRALSAFRFHIKDLWRRTLRRRSQKDASGWKRIERLARRWLPKPLIQHPWPKQRFAVKHPRWEPYARIGSVRICAGGGQQ
jgi:RNA-directed DNA polymerase